MSLDTTRIFTKYALGIVRSIPSEETLRQRMDDIAPPCVLISLAENDPDAKEKWHVYRENFQMVSGASGY